MKTNSAILVLIIGVKPSNLDAFLRLSLVIRRSNLIIQSGEYLLNF